MAIVGGGASGLVAALSAREQGASVVVLDQNLTLGEPILATGNGRCNLANIDLSPRFYNDSSFVATVMGTRPETSVRELFEALGLWLVEENGRLYPRSRQAQSVRNVLVRACEKKGVVKAPLREVLRVELPESDPSSKDARLWSIAIRDRSVSSQTGTGAPPKPVSLKATAVVVATGGGGSRCLNALNLAQSALRPGLCALRTTPSPLDALDGRKSDATVMLERSGEILHETVGEVLFREEGLTGPPILDLSRFAQPNDLLWVDLLPELSRDVVAQEIARESDRHNLPSEHALDGLLDPAIARTILECARIGWPLPTDSVIESAASLAKQLPYQVVEPLASHAQLTLGGIARSAIDPNTMAAIVDANGQAVPQGLFLSGEVLDVDGPCGGYNLAFAWLSGLKAGRAAAAFASARPARREPKERA